MTLRYQGIPSPDGKWIAYDDLESNMYILDIKTGESKKISSNNEGIRDFSWSPDSKWLAFVQTAFNSMSQIIVYNIKDESKFNLTTDRANSFSVKWSPDGKFIYFLSDRSFTLVEVLGVHASQNRIGMQAKNYIMYHLRKEQGLPLEKMMS